MDEGISDFFAFLLLSADLSIQTRLKFPCIAKPSWNGTTPHPPTYCTPPLIWWIHLLSIPLSNFEPLSTDLLSDGTSICFKPFVTPRPRAICYA